MLEYSQISAAELNLDTGKTVEFGMISAVVALQSTALGIGADFKVRYHGKFSCVRCLKKFGQDMSAELHLDYIEGKDPHATEENVELTPHDADRVYYQGPYIDLSIGIREAIMLSLPISYVCTDDCAGLCPVCGVDLNAGRCSCGKTKPGVFTVSPTRSAKRSSTKKRGRSKK